jgi:aspartyl-tRNA(Asn)/glutamyl-tRNA(Gln) amidotransferase subunit B
VPLIEIVTEPDLESPSEAREFLGRLKRALEYLEVSDCNMEEGSLRVDANISVRRPGQGLGTKTEVKNMNSFSNVERAVVFEISRQQSIRGRGDDVVHQTLLWDASRGEARPMRGKEESHDYRYFPDPDLPPLEIASSWIDEIRETVPEMPWLRSGRFRSDFGLSSEHAEQLTATREIADYFEAVVASGAQPAEAASWVMGDVLAAVHAERTSLTDFPIDARRLGGLLALVRSGQISRPSARQVFATMLRTADSPEVIVEREGLLQVRDSSALEGWVDEVLSGSSAEIARYRAGETKLIGFFVGQVMKRSAGKADPKQVTEMTKRKLDNAGS